MMLLRGFGVAAFAFGGGGEAAPAADGLALLRLLAVGLLRRSELTPVLIRDLVGAFSGVCAAFARARLAAVGAKRRDEAAGVVVVVFAGVETDGVLERGAVEEGVLGRVVREGARGVVVADREAGRAGVGVLVVVVRGFEGVVVAVPPVC
jgi:hypothetical protein